MTPTDWVRLRNIVSRLTFAYRAAITNGGPAKVKPQDLRALMEAYEESLSKQEAA